jgi:cytidylate kinase
MPSGPAPPSPVTRWPSRDWVARSGAHVSTVTETTGWPWQRPWLLSPLAQRNAVSSPDSVQSRPATRSSPRTWRASPSGGRDPGRCWWPSTGRLERANRDAVAALAAASTIEVGERVTIDGLDVTGLIRSPAVGRAVSVVAANPEVRRHLVERQRAWARAHGGGVVEGRDIGSVVFPEAEVKVYLTASAQERARRRHDEAPDGVARRDRIDSTRDASPLREAEDAHRLDTTGRTVQDVVEEVLSWL